MNELYGWPVWARGIAWTLGTISLSWAVGYAVGTFAIARFPTWLPVGQRHLAAAAATLIRRRVPWWSLLVGLWISAGYWPLTPEGHMALERTIFVIGAVSVTTTLAAIASLAVDTYGSIVAPALPVSSLTRNIAWAMVAILGLLVVERPWPLDHANAHSAWRRRPRRRSGSPRAAGELLCGLFLTLAGQVRVGDYVKLDGGLEGYVTDFSWRSTRLRMLANDLVIVPNAKLAQAIVVNHDLPSRDLAVLVEVGVDYASNLTDVERTSATSAVR